MGKSVIQRMYMEYIKENTMNEQERALDLQLGDALAEIESLKAERDALLAENEKLSDLWSLIKAERDALKAALAQPEQEPASPANILKVQALMRLMVRKFRNACSTTDYDQVYKELQRAVHEALAQPEKVKPWVGLTEQERNDTEDYCEMIIGKPAFDVIEAKLKEKNNG